MQRRQFITLLGGAVAAWPLVARAQQSTTPVIGFLDVRSPEVMGDRLGAFRQGLKETGFIEGDNVTIAYRWAENRTERLPELAPDLVRLKAAVIAAAGPPCLGDGNRKMRGPQIERGMLTATARAVAAAVLVAVVVVAALVVEVVS